MVAISVDAETNPFLAIAQRVEANDVKRPELPCARRPGACGDVRPSAVYARPAAQRRDHQARPPRGRLSQGQVRSTGPAWRSTPTACCAPRCAAFPTTAIFGCSSRSWSSPAPGPPTTSSAWCACRPRWHPTKDGSCSRARSFASKLMDFRPTVREVLLKDVLDARAVRAPAGGGSTIPASGRTRPRGIRRVVGRSHRAGTADSASAGHRRHRRDASARKPTVGHKPAASARCGAVDRRASI